MRQPSQAPLVALLTDFGLTDPYVGQMKAVLATAAPGVPILDLCHDVAPQCLIQAAFFLAASLPWLPPGSVVVAVVDPGVGTSRHIILLETSGRSVLAPDNGLLTLLLAQSGPHQAFDVTPAARPASATFHGRDVFAPLAARLAMGESGQALASRALDTGDLVWLPGLAPVRQGGRVAARVLSVDRFGNVITNCPIAGFTPLPASPALLAPVAVPLIPTTAYAMLPQGAVGILAGSQGYLELAVREASAAARLGLAPGDALTLSWPKDA